jgi:lysophospholipase L1-like esterase
MAKARGKTGVQKAAGRGRRAGAEAFTRELARMRRRQAAAPARLALRTVPPIPARTLRALNALPPPTGLLIAEGDSWFDYPFNDVLSMLEDDHGYQVESVAHWGHTVEDMAYSGEQFRDFTRLFTKLLRQGRVPSAVLLSGGGNDIAGEQFGMLLNHAASGLPPLNDDIVRGVIDVRVRNAYAFMIGGLTEIAQRYLGRAVRIIVHGYDYPIPDGRGVLGGFAFLPGPWLQPGFHTKGHGSLEANQAVVARLIDRFNTMLQQLASEAPFAHVAYVNLRNTLQSGASYKVDWANELHPTPRGFKAVAERIAAAISRRD